MKSQYGLTLTELLIALGILALMAGVIIPIVSHLKTGTETTGAEAELNEIQAAVDSMMADLMINTLPDPVGSATNNMGAFPDDNYVLHGNTTLSVHYTRKETTTYYYTCSSDGQVTQFTSP